jgi:hypothetical protein
MNLYQLTIYQMTFYELQLDDDFIFDDENEGFIFQSVLIKDKNYLKY